MLRQFNALGAKNGNTLPCGCECLILDPTFPPSCAMLHTQDLEMQ